MLPGENTWQGDGVRNIAVPGFVFIGKKHL
jgi:hypothetical protein